MTAPPGERQSTISVTVPIEKTTRESVAVTYGSVKGDASHLVLLRIAKEHLGSHTYFRKRFPAPRILLRVVHFLEDLF